MNLGFFNAIQLLQNQISTKDIYELIEAVATQSVRKGTLFNFVCLSGNSNDVF